MHYNTAKANHPQQKDMRKSLRRNILQLKFLIASDVAVCP